MSHLDRSLVSDFSELVETSRDAVAVIDARDELSFTYGELAEAISRCRSFLRARGLMPGDCVLSMLPNSIEGIVTFLAVVTSGLSYVPLHSEAVTDELSRAISLTRPKLCLFSSLVSDGLLGVAKGSAGAALSVELDGSFSWLPAEGADPVETHAGRLLLNTSGSTGEPKVIVLDIDRLWSSGKAFVARHRFLGAKSRFLNILPISYLGGLFNLCLIPMACGGSFVITETFSGRSLLNFWQQVEQFDITVLWLVPSILRGLLAIAERTSRHRVAPPVRVSACFLGTAPIDLQTKTRFEEVFGIELLENYALSETTFLTTERLDDGMPREQGSVGSPLPYVLFRFVPISADEDVEGTATTVPTEIAVRSPFLFEGYLRADGTLDPNIDAEGFFKTGDLGHLTNEGVLVVDGRLKDVIKKGGFFISLREIELLAEQSDLVEEAAAVPFTHDFYGESYRLMVRTTASNPEDVTGALGAWLRERLVRYKWPDKIEIVTDFPRTSAGKVRKKLLAQ